MGTKMAPPYANIYMAKKEGQLTLQYSDYITMWKRFIDDIFFIWISTLDKLLEFIDIANTLFPTIKFTFEYSQTSVNFLDTTIYIDNERKLRTTLYRKPTDKNLILHYTSRHPLHIKRNIIYNQALRYKRIISSPQKLNTELNTLVKIFRARGYPNRMIKQQITKACNIPRAELLKDRPKPPKQTKSKTFLTPHNTHTNTYQEKVKQLWKTHITEPALQTLWPNPPLFIKVTDKKLMDRLVHTKQHPAPQT
jgi:peptide-methionine (R)-S-oxide reductase